MSDRIAEREDCNLRPGRDSAEAVAGGEKKGGARGGMLPRPMRAPFLVLVALLLAFSSLLLVFPACTPRLQPRPVSPLYEQGASLFQKGEILEAIKVWEKVGVNDPGHEQASLMISMANSILNELVSVHLQYGATLEKEGRLAEAWQEYHRAALLDTRREDAREKMKQVEQILSPLVGYHLRQGLDLELAGKIREALQEFRLVQTFDPDNEKARESIARLQERLDSQAETHYSAGVEHFRKGYLRRARTEMMAALELKPGHAGAKSYLEAIERRLSEGEGETGVSPNEPPATLRLKERKWRLQRLMGNGDWLEARREARTLVELDPHDQEARRWLSLCRSRCQEKADYLFQQGIRHFQEEDLEAAIEAWRQVLLFEEDHRKAKEYLERASVMREKIRRIRQERMGTTS